MLQCEQLASPCDAECDAAAQTGDILHITEQSSERHTLLNPIFQLPDRIEPGVNGLAIEERSDKPFA